MFKSAFIDYKTSPLQQFADKMNEDYFNVLEPMCSVAKKHALKLKDLEIEHATSHYISLCSKLIDDIQQYIRNRQEALLPYLAELHRKSTEDHDCANCTGSCNMKHELHLTELKESHNSVKEILYRLQMVALPLYSETMYPDAYRVLRNQMALIENVLTELFFVEEAYLIPKVTEAQMKINVRS